MPIYLVCNQVGHNINSCAAQQLWRPKDHQGKHNQNVVCGKLGLTVNKDVNKNRIALGQSGIDNHNALNEDE